jgi:hypothetical protein
MHLMKSTLILAFLMKKIRLIFFIGPYNCCCQVESMQFLTLHFLLHFLWEKSYCSKSCNFNYVRWNENKTLNQMNNLMRFSRMLQRRNALQLLVCSRNISTNSIDLNLNIWQRLKKYSKPWWSLFEI